MKLPLRRVVTGHDEEGQAIVQIDDLAGDIISRRPGHSSYVVWATNSHPVDNSGRTDDAKLPVGTSLPGGTIFRVIEFAPGVAPRRHRTDSIDYAVVLSGEIDMELDDSVVHLKAGDVLVQRGTIHNWVNRGSEPCIVAVILIDAKPVTAGKQVLDAIG